MSLKLELCLLGMKQKNVYFFIQLRKKNIYLKIKRELRLKEHKI